MKDELKTKRQPAGKLSNSHRKTADRRKADAKRKQEEERLHQAVSLLNSTLESTADGILVIDSTGKVSKFNYKFLSLWRIPEALAEKRDDEILLNHVLSQLKDPETFLEKVRQLYAQPEAESFDILEFRDGRVFERLSQPQRSGNAVIGRVWSFRDVTDRRRAEEEQQQDRYTAERLAEEMSVLAEIGRIIGSTLNIDETYEKFAAETKKLIPADRIMVTLNDIHKQIVTTAYSSGLDVSGRKVGDFIPLAGTMNEVLIRTRTGLLVNPASVEELAGQYPGLVGNFRAGLRSMMCVPLISSDEVIGALHFRSKIPGLYTEQDLKLAERIGAQIAGAIANAQFVRTLERTQKALRESEDEQRRNLQISERLAEEMSIIAEIGKVIGSTLDINEVYERFAAEANKLISFDRIVVNLQNPHKENGTIAYVSGVDVPGRRQGDRIPRKGSVNDEVIRTRKGLIVQSMRGEDLSDRFPATFQSVQSGMHAAMSVPLISRDDVIGTLLFQSIKPDAFTEKDLRLAEGIGSRIAGAIANAQFYSDLRKTREESERYSKQLAALHKTGLELMSELNLNALLQSIAQRALDLIGGLYCNCFLYKPEEDLLERVAIAGQHPFPGAIKRRYGEDFSGYIWTIKAPFMTNDYHSWPGRNREQDSEQPLALVGTPIHWGEEFLGVLNIGAYLPRQFTSSDVEILSRFSMQAAIAIRNARLYDKIEQLAVTDELTELLNRRGFFQLGEREFERALRFKRPLAALMFDIDHFKAVNDAHGHAAGDEVLQALAACFRQNSRGIDVAGRYGGEEFALLVPEIPFPEAIRIAERLRQSIADLSIPVGTANSLSPTVLRITTSIGAAFMLPDVSSLTDLIDRSDQALYCAKASGRNRVAVWKETKAHKP